MLRLMPRLGQITVYFQRFKYLSYKRPIHHLSGTQLVQQLIAVPNTYAEIVGKCVHTKVVSHYDGWLYLPQGQEPAVRRSGRGAPSAGVPAWFGQNPAI